MNHTISYQHCIEPERREPTEEQIQAVADSIYKHLAKNPNEWRDAAVECLQNEKSQRFGEYILNVRFSDAGWELFGAAHDWLKSASRDLAESWFVDDYTKHDRQRLTGWAPYDHRMVGTCADWLERLP